VNSRALTSERSCFTFSKLQQDKKSFDWRYYKKSENDERVIDDERVQIVGFAPDSERLV